MVQLPIQDGKQQLAVFHVMTAFKMDSRQVSIVEVFVHPAPTVTTESKMETKQE